MNSNHTSVSAVRSVEQWSFPTRCFMRFKLGQSRTMSTIVRTIASAFNPNARGIARFHGRLYSRQFSFFTLLFFAHFIVSPIRLVRKALPLRFRQSTLMESSANHAILKSACFFVGYPRRFATRALWRFQLSESRTIYPTVLATGSAFERNTGDLGCVSVKLHKTRFSFFSRELFALFLILLFRFIGKERLLS